MNHAIKGRFDVAMSNPYFYILFIPFVYTDNLIPIMNSTSNSTSQTPSNGIGAVSFTPLLAPNALFVTLFTILFIIQIILTVRFWRFYGYAIGMLGGLLLELLGYAAKVQLSHNRANKNGYIMLLRLLPFQ